MPERPNGAVLKTVVRKHPGFESLSLRSVVFTASPALVDALAIQPRLRTRASLTSVTLSLASAELPVDAHNAVERAEDRPYRQPGGDGHAREGAPGRNGVVAAQTRVGQSETSPTHADRDGWPGVDRRCGEELPRTVPKGRLEGV